MELKFRQSDADSVGIANKGVTSLGSRATGEAIPYRPDIDGLRALAVIAVILYHGFPTVFTGGFIGVDVFFVISGFLISGNIFRRLEDGRFTFRDFYARRIRRIFPALFVVLVPCLAYGFLVLLPHELALLGLSVGGGAAFVANLLLWHQAGYFDQAAIMKPLLHLWSLGVEEQFYIVWPAALWLLYRRRRRNPTMLLLIGALSLAFSVAIVRRAPTEDFYSPLTRLWELDAGALLAFAVQGTGGARAADWMTQRLARLTVADLVSLAGSALIIGPILLFDRRLAFPGGLALLPVVGALLLITAGPAALFNRAVLCNRAAVFIGLISYPLYLWHWPLISFSYNIDHGRPLKAGLVCILIAVSVLLAWLTYRFFERPLRFGGNRRRNTSLLVLLMLCVGAAGFLTWAAGGFPARYPRLPDLSIAKINAAIGNGIFESTPSMRVRKLKGITVSRIGSGEGKVLFTGDSVIYQYGARVQALLDQGRLGKTVYFAAGASCPPVPGVVRVGGFAYCNHLPGVMDSLIARKHIGVIVLGANWADYETPVISVRRDGRLRKMNTPAGVDAFYANLKDEIRHFVQTHHSVYLVAEPVNNPRFNPQRMVRRSAFGFRVSRNVVNGVQLNRLVSQSAATDRRLNRIAAETGAKVLNPLRDVCGDGPVCSAFFDHGEPKFADGLHLRPVFVAHHIRIFDRLLTPSAGAAPSGGQAAKPVKPTDEPR